jgi:hypothetical protein
VPITGRDLDDYCCAHVCGAWFGAYGLSRKFPMPIDTWSPQQVKRAFEHYMYEIEVGTLVPA